MTDPLPTIEPAQFPEWEFAAYEAYGNDRCEKENIETLSDLFGPDFETLFRRRQTFLAMSIRRDRIKSDIRKLQRSLYETEIEITKCMADAEDKTSSLLETALADLKYLLAIAQKYEPDGYRAAATIAAIERELGLDTKVQVWESGSGKWVYLHGDDVRYTSEPDRADSFTIDELRKLNQTKEFMVFGHTMRVMPFTQVQRNLAHPTVREFLRTIDPYFPT